MHFHADLPVALAGFAPAAGNVEAEAACGVAALSRIRRHGKDLADVVEHLGVGGGVGTGRAAYGRLVDGNDAFYLLKALHALHGAGLFRAQAAVTRHAAVERVDDEGALARTGNAGDAGENPERDGAVDVLQVVGGHAAQGEELFGAAALFRHGDGKVAAKVARGEGIGVSDKVLHRAGKHEFPALGAGAGPHFQHGVRLADGGFVVFHHKHGVAALLKAAEGADEPFVVARVQAYGRFVQHIRHAHKAGTELGGKAYALGLAAGERGHGAAEGEVFQAHVDHEAQAEGKFLDERFGNEGVASREGEALHPRKGAFYGKIAEFLDVEVVHAHGKRFLPEPRAVAGGAFHLVAVAAQNVAPGIAALHALFQQVHDPRPVRGGKRFPAFVMVQARAAHEVAAQAPRAGDAARFAVEQGLSRLVGKISEGRVHGKALPLAESLQRLADFGHEIGAGEGGEGALAEGKAFVGRNEGFVEGHHRAYAEALGARALGAVEGKKLRRGNGRAHMAGGAYRFGGMHDVGLARHAHDDAALAVAQGQFHGVGKAGAHVVLDDEPVHHKVDAVLFVLVEGRNLIEVVDCCLFPQRGHAHAHEAFGLQLLEAVGMGAFLQFHKGSHEHDALAFGHGHDVRNDFIGGAGLDGRAAVGAVHLAEPGEEHAQKVVHLRHRAHGGTGVVRRGLLFQRYGGGKPLDFVHQGLVHLGQEHARVGGERFHIAALPLGVHDVEGQGGLARAGRPAYHHEFVAGNVHVDVFKIMLPGALDMDAGPRDFSGQVHAVPCCLGGRRRRKKNQRRPFFSNVTRRTTFS